MTHLSQNLRTGEHQATDWLWPGIERALIDNNLLSRAAIVPLQTSRVFDEYKRVAPAVMAELGRLVDGSAREKRGLAYVVGCSLIAYTKQQKLPERPRFVLGQVKNARAALEVCFPGYIQAGLLNLILGGRRDGKISDDRKGPTRT